MGKPTTLTVAEAASLVFRSVAKKDKDGKVVLDKDGNPVPVSEAVKPEEIMIGSDGNPAIAEYEDRVVVVTTAGEKLACEKSSDAWKAFAKSRK